jgi:outer membrane protein assembly factor BamB
VIASLGCLQRLAVVVAVALFASRAAAGANDNWPHWRGPTFDGHAAPGNWPVRWDAKSVLWKTPLKGRGQSSPIVWGERIFLTTALENGKDRVVFCLDRKDGKLLWEHVAWTGTPEKTHKMNGWATASCATDGERVVAFFGRGGLHCYSVDGKQLWSRDLGPFEGPWGTSASPIIVGDVVIQNCDAEQEAYLLAADVRSGKTIWRTPRTVPDKGGWSTPVVVDAGGRQEIVVNGAKAVTGYDLKTGKVLWSCKSFNGRGEPTATPGLGMVFMVNGLKGDMYAVRPGGTGDVTSSHMVWHTPRKGGRDQPSPIVIGDYLIVATMDGIATGYEAKTGKELWKERMDGTFTSSPIAAGGLAYFQSDAGVTYVLQPGPNAKLVSRNTLPAAPDELFRASLTPSAGQIFSRSDQMLFCIGAK